jgi:hypothetical protein
MDAQRSTRYRLALVVDGECVDFWKDVEEMLK